ncbi:tetratricopeptide repeat protein [Streptomyces silvensis]|uniref:Sel1 repeat family protein n=1 Tax=Streptomyces silvensis TaxID=1765722 RepID=A0A0W7X9D5_9ACTN|nr:sel1 repeat family protein [Streptomyces silvensis]KUF19509.1 hypothetical protein AT728_03750 [Streptomyces silvensis]
MAGGTVHHLIQTGTVHSLTLHAGHPAHAGSLPAPHDWPRADQVDPVALGVRRSRRFGNETGLPPYVRRDVDSKLDALVVTVYIMGGLLVVTGPALSGTSRTAWEAVRRNTPTDTRIFAPSPGTDLRALPALLRAAEDKSSYALWLDELDGHIGENGLDVNLLAQLTALHVPVIATMRDEVYDTHRFGRHPASRLLGGADTVELTSLWSEAERTRLAAADDPRLVDAVRWRGDSGVTEFLALGPELWDEWRRARRAAAHPHGHRLVRAAVDLARCGIEGDIPQSLLRGVIEVYGAAPAGKPFGEALLWAYKKRHDVTGLLVRGSTSTRWRPYGSLVADAARSPESEPVPDDVWILAIDAAKSDPGLPFTALAEAFRGILLARAERGDVDAMTALAALALDLEDVEAAMEWYGAAARLGDARAGFELGMLLAEHRSEVEAIPYLETAAAKGLHGAASVLADLYQRRCAHWLRMAADRREPEALNRLKGPLSPQSTIPPPGTS